LNRPGNADALAPIYGMTAGLVIFAGLLPSTWGDVIVVQYEIDGVIIYARHAHVDSYLVSAGQQIEQGQLLGYVGNANGQLPHHLHFDLSPTNILKTTPGHWPGDNLLSLRQNYIEPRGLLLASHEGLVGKALFVKSAANFRAGPKTSYLVYSVLQSGTQVVAMGTAVDDYSLVRVGTEYGFVHVGLLTDDDPPSPAGIDLTRFMVADPTCWRVVRGPGGQEDVQDLQLGNGLYVRRKNQLAEWWKVDGQYFYLVHDTSPAPAESGPEQGIERVYTITKGGQPGAPKNPLAMAVGQSWTESGSHQVQFKAKADCKLLVTNSGNATNTAVLTDYKQNYVFNGYGQNLKFEEVIWLQTGQETQIYGRKDGKPCGWLGGSAPWWSSEPVEIHWDRPPMVSEPNRYCSW
jgi:Peptidase family M23